MPDPGHRTQPHHHLLVHDQHRDQQQQHPQQAVAVVLPGLRVGRHPAGVVVADHHDQPGPDDRQQGRQPGLHRAGTIGVADADPAQRALDVAQMRAVEHRRAPWRWIRGAAVGLRLGGASGRLWLGVAAQDVVVVACRHRGSSPSRMVTRGSSVAEFRWCPAPVGGRVRGGASPRGWWPPGRRRR